MPANEKSYADRFDLATGSTTTPSTVEDRVQVRRQFQYLNIRHVSADDADRAREAVQSVRRAMWHLRIAGKGARHLDDLGLSLRLQGLEKELYTVAVGMKLRIPRGNQGAR